MSSPSTTFRVFYPDSNTVTALHVYDPTGAALTPQTLAEGADDPAGFKSKVLTFAAASEPLFATPTFTHPAAPVSLYLTRDTAGVFNKVLDESLFNPVDPGRPTPYGDQQQWLLYTATDLEGGIQTYAGFIPTKVRNPPQDFSEPVDMAS